MALLARAVGAPASSRPAKDDEQLDAELDEDSAAGTAEPDEDEPFH